MLGLARATAAANTPFVGARASALAALHMVYMSIPCASHELYWLQDRVLGWGPRHLSNMYSSNTALLCLCEQTCTCAGKDQAQTSSTAEECAASSVCWFICCSFSGQLLPDSGV